MKIKFLLFFVFTSTFSFSQKSIDCYTIVAGRKTTTTHSVLVAHNEDDYGDLIVNLYKVPAQNHSEKILKLISGIEIPETKHTYSYVWFETTQQNFGDFFVNQYGVTICSNACASKNNAEKGLISYNLRKIVAQRASSARKAVEIAGKLVEKYGYASSGRTYCFADAREAWLMDIVKGKHWVAQRVADDKVAIVPNYYTIGEINLKDSANFLASKDIISFATKKGWYKKKSGKPFNFSQAYSLPQNLYAFWNIPRHWSGINQLSNKKYGLYDNFPFAFDAKNKISVQILENVLSSHYEGTDFEACKYRETNPHKNLINRICNPGTKFSVIIELHNTYPENNKNTIWFAPFNPCINPYIPIACDIDSFPEVFHKYNFSEAMKYHFDKKSNTFEANPKLAYSVFHSRNTKIDAHYWKKSIDAKKFKHQFEQKSRNEFNKKPSGKTSYKLLMEYYNYSINNRKK